MCDRVMVVSAASGPLFLRRQTYPTARRNYHGKNSSEVKRRERERKTERQRSHRDTKIWKNTKELSANGERRRGRGRQGGAGGGRG